jgi:hypothetical protein
MISESMHIASSCSKGASGFLHKSDLYGLVTQKLGQQIQNFDGLVLKTTVLYF